MNWCPSWRSRPGNTWRGIILPTIEYGRIRDTHYCPNKWLALNRERAPRVRSGALDKGDPVPGKGTDGFPASGAPLLFFGQTMLENTQQEV